MENIRLFILIQFGVTLIGSLILFGGRDSQSAASFAAGSGVVLMNVIVLAFTWSRMIQKKLIALSVSVIVFKYAILGIIIYKLLSFAWIHKMWFCVGLSSLVVSALFYASIAPTSDEDEEKDTEK
jgi:hypothetical protein